MMKRQGFTLIELLAVIAVVLVIIVIVVTIQIATRPPGQIQMKNRTQQTAIAKSMIFWSDQFYQQGLEFPRTGLTPAPGTFTPNMNWLANNQIPNNRPENRIQCLLNMGSDVLAPQMLINPVGTDTPYSGSDTIPNIVLAPNNLSYAMLDAKNVEWANRVNAGVPLLCDRQVPGQGANGSFWNNQYWEGSVCWGDTHVTWESGKKSTYWPKTKINGVTNPHDDLFAGAAGPTSTDTLMYNPGDPAGN